MLVLLGGCGQFNDNPATTSLSASVSFAGVSQPAATTTAVTTCDPTTELCSPDTAHGGPVQMLVIGPIVIPSGHAHGSGTDGAWTSADVNNISDTDRQNLIDDAEQSAQYVTLVTLPNPNVVHFVIPPDGAGNWQLVAVGLDQSFADLSSVTNASATWFGFVGHFLNGEIQPGEQLQETLTVQPWCAPNGPISQASGATATTCP